MRKLYLNELFEDYIEGNEKKKMKCVDKFKRELWDSKCEFKVYSRYFTIKIIKKLLNNRRDLIDLFDKYKRIEYKICKSQYKEILPRSIDYIRLHINNMYGFLFDKEVYYDKEYYNLLKVPKEEYFKIVKQRNADEVDAKSIRKTIEDTMRKAENIKQQSIDKKFNLSWSSYQRLINEFIDKIFTNYKPIEEYERDKEWDMDILIDGWNEDNFIVGYFCKSLTGYMRNYMKKLRSEKYKQCEVCGDLIEKTGNKLKYCPECLREKQLVWQRESMKKLRKKQICEVIENSPNPHE